MENKIKVFYAILVVIWLLCIAYFIVNEQWFKLIKNILIFVFSFIGGMIYSYVTRGDR